LKHHEYGWEFKIWTDDNVQELIDFDPKLKNIIEFQLSSNVVHAVDFLQMVALKKYGGIYLDIDMICLQSF
jgi:mannosyltransferase OCH1-like enzyme